MNLIFPIHPRGPQLNHWVWVTNYIDFTSGQRELCRVISGNYPNQLILHGHWRLGKWRYTEVYIGLYPHTRRGWRKKDFVIRKIGHEPVSTTIPMWEAEWIKS